MKISVLLFIATSLIAKSGFAKDNLDPNKKVELPIYDTNGKQTGTRKIKAQELWNEVDFWKQETLGKYQSRSANEMMRAQPSTFSNGERHENWIVPQEPEQQFSLRRQQDELIYTTMPVDTGFNPVFGPPVNTPRYVSKGMNNNYGNNGTFGVQQNAYFYTNGSETSVEYSDNFDVTAYLFGSRIKLVSKSTSKYTTTTTKRTKTDIKVVDTTVYVTERTNDRSNPSLTRSVERTKVFYVAFPISVSGKISGTVGANIDYNVDFLKFNGSIRPYVNSGGSVYAGVDLWLVKAGVSGSLTFINAEVKAAFNAAMDLSNRLLTGRLDVSQAHDLLSGKISLYATINYLFGSSTYTYDIFSWVGIKGNSTIASDSIRYQF